MFKKLFNWFVNLFLIFPRKKAKYGLTFYRKKDKNNLEYLDVSYNFKLTLDPEFIKCCEKMEIPLTVVLANKFKEELDEKLSL